MKRSILLCLGLTAFMGSNLPGTAQSAANTAAAIADWRDAEERYRRLNSAVENLLAAQAAQQKRLADLTIELQRLRERIDRLNDQPVKYASLNDLKNLAEKLLELDRKREADKKLILDELQKLAKAPPIIRESSSEHASPPPRSEGKGYEYVVEPGNTLSGIVEAYRKKGVKVTLDQVRRANPKIKGDTIKVGMTLFIPDSSQP